MSSAVQREWEQRKLAREQQAHAANTVKPRLLPHLPSPASIPVPLNNARPLPPAPGPPATSPLPVSTSLDFRQQLEAFFLLHAELAQQQKLWEQRGKEGEEMEELARHLLAQFSLSSSRPAPSSPTVTAPASPSSFSPSSRSTADSPRTPAAPSTPPSPDVACSPKASSPLRPAIFRERVELDSQARAHSDRLFHDLKQRTSMNHSVWRELCNQLSTNKSSQDFRFNDDKGQGSDGRRLELMTALLLHCLGYEVLRCGGGANDHGVDVHIRATERTPRGAPATAVVQCKQMDKKVPEAVVNQLVGTARQHEVAHCVVVTTGRFTSQATTCKNKHNALSDSITVELWDGENLKDLLGMVASAITDKIHELIQQLTLR